MSISEMKETILSTCFSNTSIWVSGGEKFLLKSRPHSPIATHSAHLKKFFAIYTKYIYTGLLTSRLL